MSVQEKTMDVRRLTVTAMLAALAYAAVLLSHVIFPVKIEGFLSLDIKDSVMLLGALLYGPVTGFLLALVVSVLELTISTTGWIGLIMNVVSSALFICPAAGVWRRRKNARGLALGLIAGALAMTAGMLLWNLVLTPIYMGVARSFVVGLLLPVILPFNLLKAALNSALTVMLFRPVQSALSRARLLPQPEVGEAAPSRTRRAVTALGGLLVAAALIWAALKWSGVL